MTYTNDWIRLAVHFKNEYEVFCMFRRVLVLNTRKSIEDALVKHASSFSGREGFYTEKYQFNVNQKGRKP